MNLVSPPLHSMLQKAARRIRLLILVRTLPLGVLAAAAAALLWSLLAHAGLFHPPSVFTAVMLITGGALCGALFALFYPLSPLKTACITEERANLKQRLSSALLLQSSAIDFHAALLADAGKYADSLNIKQLFPLRPPRSLYAAAPALLLLFFLYFLPPLPYFWSSKKKADYAEMHRQARIMLKIASLAKLAAGKHPQPGTAQIARELKRLADAMQHNKVSPEQAQLQRQQLTSQMKEMLNKISKQSSLSQQRQAARLLQQALNEAKKHREQNRPQQGAGNDAHMHPPHAAPSAAMRKALQAVQKMQQAMQANNAAQMQKAMQQLAAALKQGGLTQTEMSKMAQLSAALGSAMKMAGMSRKQAEQMMQMSRQMQGLAQPGAFSNVPLSGSAMQSIAAQMQHLAGQLKAGRAHALDSQALEQMLLAMQNQNGDVTYFGMHQPGSGINGLGARYAPGIAPAHPNAKLTYAGRQAVSGKGKKGSLSAFTKYLKMMAHKHPDVLPNGQIKGGKSRNGDQLTIITRGAPTPNIAFSPLYQAVETGKREAESALVIQRVPASLKQQVHNYFAGLPNSK